MWEIFESLCAKNGVTTADVCKATQIPQSTMSNWKKRRNRINVKHGQKIADYFGVSLDFLMTGHEAQGVIEADAPEIFRILHNDNIIEGNPDLKYIVDTVGKWSPEQQKRLRRYVEEVNRIVGGE